MLVEPLYRQAIRQPAELAIIDDRHRVTYQQLAAMASGLGKHFQAVTRNPRLGLLLPAGAGFVASFYGTLSAGKTAVPLNFLLSEREIAHCIADSQIDTVVTAPPLAAKLDRSGLRIVDLTQFEQTPAAFASSPSTSRGDNDVAVL